MAAWVKGSGGRFLSSFCVVTPARRRACFCRSTRRKRFPVSRRKSVGSPFDFQGNLGPLRGDGRLVSWSLWGSPSAPSVLVFQGHFEAGLVPGLPSLASVRAVPLPASLLLTVTGASVWPWLPGLRTRPVVAAGVTYPGRLLSFPAVTGQRGGSPLRLRVFFLFLCRVPVPQYLTGYCRHL